MQLPSLSQILHKGAPGGHSFAHLLKLLFEAEARSTDNFVVRNFDDCSGDIDGADLIIESGLTRILIQSRFYQSPLKAQQRLSIKRSFEIIKDGLSENTEWWLLTPDDLMKRDFEWFQSSFPSTCRHKGWSYLTALFLKHPEIGRLAYPNHNFQEAYNKVNVPVSPESYFRKFLEPDIDIKQMLAQAQPTFYDCKRVFTSEWWQVMGDFYTEFYRDVTTFEREDERINEHINVFVDKMSRPTEQRENDIELVAINKTAEFYTVNFSSEREQPGYIYSFWSYINGRWVFFGKIRRNLNAVERMKSHDLFLTLLRLSKCFRIKNKVKDIPEQRLRFLAGQLIREIKK
jgi:hypothetical protein